MRPRFRLPVSSRACTLVLLALALPCPALGQQVAGRPAPAVREALVGAAMDPGFAARESGFRPGLTGTATADAGTPGAEAAFGGADAESWSLTSVAGDAPHVRFGHSAVYDPVRRRMVVFGGYYHDGERHYLNDVHVLSLDGTPAWTQLAPTGTPPAGRGGHTAIYDPARDRMIVFGGYSFDDVNQTEQFYGDAYALSLGDSPTWTQLTPAGEIVTGRYAHSAVYDPVDDCMIVFGGYNRDAGVGMPLADTYVLSLGETPAWSRLSYHGGAPAARMWHSAIYDPPRERMIVFGGFSDTYLDDVHSLELAGSVNWSQLSPAGTAPATRYLHSAIYDPVRDRMVVFGGFNSIGSIHNLGDTQALLLSSPPAWSQLVPSGTPPSPREGHGAIYDPVLDGMRLFGGENFSGAATAYFDETWALTWGAPVSAESECPGDVVWTTSATIPLSYGIRNPYSFNQTADYTMTSGRGWPGFPISGSMELAPGWTPVDLGIPIPDTAVVGLNPLTFRATLRGVSQTVECSHNLHDSTTPALLALVSAEAEPGVVRLTWYAAGGMDAATVYRRTVDEDWSALARVTPDGSGLLSYEDRAVTPGARYGYRLGVTSDGVEEYTGETWVEVPRTVALALSGARPNPATAELAVKFTLPDAGPARLEAFDLAGRKVASREVGSLGGGSHVVRLGERGRLAPGVYLLRLTQGGRAHEARAVIVR